jgi:hypothetical protein
MLAETNKTSAIFENFAAKAPYRNSDPLLQANKYILYTNIN